jgi:hypothetical protein
VGFGGDGGAPVAYRSGGGVGGLGERDVVTAGLGVAAHGVGACLDRVEHHQQRRADAFVDFGEPDQL